MINQRVSIAMATYNGGRFLREQLDSLYSQSYQPYEIVVCDDNSKDETQTILEEYHQKKGLRYYINDNNLGPTGNFYKAISLCEGDYVMISDQDDVWHPNKVEESLEHMLKIDDGKPSLVSSLCQNIDSEGNHLGPTLPDKPDTQGYKYIFVTDSSAQGCSLMLNKALIDKVFSFTQNNATSLEVMYDYFIGMVASLYGNSYQCGKRLMNYRHHDKNVVAVDRGSRSFITKVKESHKIVHFLSDGIFDACIIGENIFNKGDEKQEAKELLHKVAAIGKSSSFIKQMEYLFSIPEIDLSDKIRIASENLVVKMIKLFVKKI